MKNLSEYDHILLEKEEVTNGPKVVKLRPENKYLLDNIDDEILPGYKEYIRETNSCWYEHNEFLQENGFFNDPEKLEYIVNLWNDMTVATILDQSRGLVPWGNFLLYDVFFIDEQRSKHSVDYYFQNLGQIFPEVFNNV